MNLNDITKTLKEIHADCFNLFLITSGPHRNWFQCNISTLSKPYRWGSAAGPDPENAFLLALKAWENWESLASIETSTTPSLDLNLEDL